MTSMKTIHQIAIGIASAVGLQLIPGAAVKGDGNCFIRAIVSQEIPIVLIFYSFLYPFITDNGQIGDI